MSRLANPSHLSGELIYQSPPLLFLVLARDGLTPKGHRWPRKAQEGLSRQPFTLSQRGQGVARHVSQLPKHAVTGSVGLSILRRSDTPFAEFERLGEAEVKERLGHNAFDNIHRIYALRWLNQKGGDRFRAAQREAAAKKAEQDRIRRRAQLMANAALVAAVMALVIALLVSHRTLFGSEVRFRLLGIEAVI